MMSSHFKIKNMKNWFIILFLTIVNFSYAQIDTSNYLNKFEYKDSLNNHIRVFTLNGVSALEIKYNNNKAQFLTEQLGVLYYNDERFILDKEFTSTFYLAGVISFIMKNDIKNIDYFIIKFPPDYHIYSSNKKLEISHDNIIITVLENYISMKKKNQFEYLLYRPEIAKTIINGFYYLANDH